ncbi:MAG: T9SS type A sorting domain-containing protein [Chitinophagaceae bacterium]|nr:T9SS type A sorting domain-containing protein [Chitinophagaceae bacterium]
MKNPFTLSIIVLCFSFSSATAQVTAPEIQWQNTIGGSGVDYLNSVIQTIDGGYLLGGYSYSGISGDKTEANQGDFSFSYDYWVVKLDVSGNIQWQNTIGGSSYDYLLSVIQTTDGGYLLGGYSSSGISGDKTEASQGSYDYWVVKLDGSGNIQWQNTIGGNSSDYLNSAIQTSDGGYLLGGYSGSGISGDKTEANQVFTYDYWVVKLDGSGNILWQNTIGGNSFDELSSAIQTSDGGYLLGGYSGSGISGDKTEASLGGYDYWVVKLDALGNIQWQNTIGGEKEDQLTSVIQTTDGGYLLGGFSKSGISGDKTESRQGRKDYWVVKLDGSGAIQWQNTIGGSGDDALNSVIQTTDDGYLLGGTSDSGQSGDNTEEDQGFKDYWVVKLNSSGNIEWQNTIGGSSYDLLRSLIQTADGGFLLGGDSQSGIYGDKTEANQGIRDYWVLKLSAEGCNAFTVFADADNDSYGDAANSFFATDCVIPSGYVANDLDCNDANADIHSGAIEIINGIDDDCNGLIDECSIPAILITKALTANSAKLKWDPLPTATGYSLRYKVASSGTWTVLNPQAHTKTIAGLSPNTKYVWQIKSVCSNDPKTTSAWSPKQFFTTLPLKITNENAAATSLEIYPNPSSGNTTLHFNLTQSSQVSIKIFDVNGKEISKVLNSSFEAGDHSQQINTASFSKGIYLVQMISGNGIQNQKLIVQ